MCSRQREVGDVLIGKLQVSVEPAVGQQVREIAETGAEPLEGPLNGWVVFSRGYTSGEDFCSQPAVHIVLQTD